MLGSSETSITLDLDSSKYQQRHDTASIKRDLELLVPSEEYWRTFKLYVHGKCQKADFDRVIETYLKTQEARHKHNQLIRAILYNAHFSRIPPPNYVFKPRYKKSDASFDVKNLVQTKPHKFSSFYAADIHAIPSVLQIKKRLEQKLLNKGNTIQMDCVEYIHNQLKRYITYVLSKSLESIGRPSCSKRVLSIGVENLMEAVDSDERINSVISNNTKLRFQNLC